MSMTLTIDTPFLFGYRRGSDTPGDHRAGEATPLDGPASYLRSSWLKQTAGNSPAGVSTIVSSGVSRVGNQIWAALILALRGAL